MVRKHQQKRGSLPYLTGYTDAALKEAVKVGHPCKNQKK